MKLYVTNLHGCKGCCYWATVYSKLEGQFGQCATSLVVRSVIEHAVKRSVCSGRVKIGVVVVFFGGEWSSGRHYWCSVYVARQVLLDQASIVRTNIEPRK